MQLRHHIQMMLLAAIWGGSFLFLKVCAPVIGPLAVAAGRVSLAALLLLPLAWRHIQPKELKPLAPTLLLSGILSCALPFMGLSTAARSLPAGLLSILNATTPLWGALVGWLWAKERLSLPQITGLLAGFSGVVWLASVEGQHIQGSFVWPAALALGSTLMYALAVHHSKKYLGGLQPVVVTTGSLMGAALLLIGPAIWLGPQSSAQFESVPLQQWLVVPTHVWWAMLALAALCTAWAYWLFFKLIGDIGPSRALTVTFLIPVFGMLWGALFLGEQISPVMIACTGVIVGGTLLSVRRPG